MDFTGRVGRKHSLILKEFKEKFWWILKKIVKSQTKRKRKWKNTVEALPTDALNKVETKCCRIKRRGKTLAIFQIVILYKCLFFQFQETSSSLSRRTFQNPLILSNNFLTALSQQVPTQNLSKLSVNSIHHIVRKRIMTSLLTFSFSVFSYFSTALKRQKRIWKMSGAVRHEWHVQWKIVYVCMYLWIRRAWFTS